MTATKYKFIYYRASLVAQMVDNLPANAGDPGLIPGSGRSPGEGSGTPLAWEIPQTEKSGGLQSMGLQRVGHDLVPKQQQHVMKIFQE